MRTRRARIRAAERNRSPAWYVVMRMSWQRFGDVQRELQIGLRDQLRDRQVDDGARRDILETLLECDQIVSGRRDALHDDRDGRGRRGDLLEAERADPDRAAES